MFKYNHVDRVDNPLNFLWQIKHYKISTLKSMDVLTFIIDILDNFTGNAKINFVKETRLIQYSKHTHQFRFNNDEILP